MHLLLIQGSTPDVDTRADRWKTLQLHRIPGLVSLKDCIFTLPSPLPSQGAAAARKEPMSLITSRMHSALDACISPGLSSTFCAV